MKLIQLNVWQGRLLNQVVKFLTEQDPDIICLQELTSSDIKVPGFLETNTLQQLLQRLNVTHHSYAARWQYSLMGGTASYGLGTISRFPIIEEKVVFTAGEYNADMVYGRDVTNTMANALRTTIDMDGKTVDVYNHHGYWLPNPNGDATSISSMANLAAWTDQSHGPVIVVGDLNVWPQSPALASLDQRFRNLTRESGAVSTLSQLGKVQLPCDYVFVNDAVRVHNFEVSEQLVSDHKALILDFEL
jgi:endonuclease/exonuclease/phosphatase family metal-dependent hydrolase